jgi:shikimate dehydrogenase
MPLPSLAPPLSGRTALVGVLGDPVRHSLSPAMHNAALRELGLDWVYLALPTPAAELATVLRALEAMDCRGLNVTLPHKQAVAALAGELSPLAQRLGAVNTLVRRAEGGWHGTNTDVEGFLAPLREPGGEVGAAGSSGRGWAERQALVLGCGGSARAVVAGLVQLGLGGIQVVGRHSDALERFRQGCSAWAPGLGTLAWSDPALELLLASSDLVVNTTPVGMASGVATAEGAGTPDHCPLEAPLLEALPVTSTVYDLIYTPRPTALLQRAAARGCRTVDGLEMLVQQGAAALRLWCGRQEVPVAAMRRAALDQLQAP